jgi:uncharacterized membrane protein YgdD (TMEM256/DUF423 family)
VALLGAAHSKRPGVTAALFSGGVALFAGGCYTVSYFRDLDLGKPTPVGGGLLILGWLSLLL